MYESFLNKTMNHLFQSIRRRKSIKIMKLPKTKFMAVMAMGIAGTTQLYDCCLQLKFGYQRIYSGRNGRVIIFFQSSVDH